MLALLPMLLTLVPDLVRWIAGDSAGTVAQQITSVVSAVAGDATPEALAAAIADPAKATDLRLQLAKVAADAEDAKRRADLEEMKLALADVAGARQQTISLAAAGSHLAYGAPVISAIVLVTLAVLAWIVVWRPLPVGSETLVAALLETFKVLAVSVVSYWVGSSAGSARKDQAIAAGGGTTRPFGQ